MDDLLPEFIAEANDILEKANQSLDSLLQANDKTQVLDAVFRSIHTIKGSSSMFNFVNTKNVAHELETRMAGLKLHPELVDENEVAHIRGEVQKLEALLKSKDDPSAISAALPVPTAVQGGVATAAVEAKPVAAQTASAKDETSRLQTAPAAATEEFIRVPVSKVNETMSGISEVFLIRNQMVYLVERFKSGQQDQKDFLQSWDLLDSALRRGIGELERSAISMRMMSVQGLLALLFSWWVTSGKTSGTSV